MILNKRLSFGNLMESINKTESKERITWMKTFIEFDMKLKWLKQSAILYRLVLDTNIARHVTCSLL